MQFDFVPKSLALIPDGNRRWAKAHKISVLNGYSNGVKKFIDFSEWCSSYNIHNLTVWALSTENLKRHTTELNALFNIYRKVCRDRSIINRLHENDAKVRIIGNADLIPKDLYASLKSIEHETESNSKSTINMLIGYGGADDIISAAKKLASKAAHGYTINEESFRDSLISSDVPNIDFVVRTSGEMRLSGFMPWQSGYSELYFSKKLWPDFTKRDLYYALADYNRRERRFGK